jgi:hypothetical protein
MILMRIYYHILLYIDERAKLALVISQIKILLYLIVKDVRMVPRNCWIFHLNVNCFHSSY